MEVNLKIVEFGGVILDLRVRAILHKVHGTEADRAGSQRNQNHLEHLEYTVLDVPAGLEV